MHFFSLFFREKVRFRAKIFHIGRKRLRVYTLHNSKKQ